MKLNSLRGGAVAVAILASAGIANAVTVTVGRRVDPSVFPDSTLAPTTLSRGSVFVPIGDAGQIPFSWNPFGQGPTEDTAHSWVDVNDGGSATYDINGTASSDFTLVWGSPNPTNMVTFMDGGTVIATVMSADLWSNITYHASVTINLPLPGFLVTISGVGPYNSVVLSQAAKAYGGDGGFFEFAVALPEPSTWTMMIAGFAGLGFAGYRRQKLVQAG
jgi:hypothetical protein